MTEISGRLRVGEASATARALQSRAGVSRYLVMGVSIALFLACIGASDLIVRALLRGPDGSSISHALAMVPGLLIGALLYAPIVRRFAQWRYRDTFVRKSLPLDLPLRIQLTPEHLVYEIGDTVSYAKWRCVTELFRSHDYWIFMAQGSGVFAPRRLFANQPDEHRFIVEALSHMSLEARQRSSEAVAASAWE